MWAVVDGGSMKADEHRLHIRRCHVCHSVSERFGEPVEQCDHCGKPMAPYYYLNELEVEPHSDNCLRPVIDSDEGELRPVRGLSAYW